MDCKNSNFTPLKHVKLEQDISDYYNNNEYCIEDHKKINFVTNYNIKCKNKCFDIVDKWVARVVVKFPTNNNWHSIVDREVTLLKVRYPFLTDQQLRGKALMKFGIASTCGNIVRTGSGKVTGAIANELSRKKNKKTRLPAAFKVLKKFVPPCINKFETKSEKNVWPQENQQTSTLYNRGTVSFKEDLQSKGIITKGKMEKKYWRLPETKPFMKNLVNEPISSSFNDVIINNALEQISCSAVTPKKKQPPVLQRKVLLSQFNDSDTPIIIQCDDVEKSQKKIKNEMLCRKDQQCSEMIPMNYKENMNKNIKHEISGEKHLNTPMLQYSQMSPESKNFLKYAQSVLKIKQKSPKNNENHQKQDQALYFSEEPKIVFESIKVDSDNYEHPIQKFNIKQYQSPISINCQSKTSFSSAPSVNSLPLAYSSTCIKTQQVKRNCSEFITDTQSSQKNFKYNNDQIQKMKSNDSNFQQIHELFHSQTISNLSNYEFSRSEDHYTTFSRMNRANSAFEPTPCSGNLSSFGEYDNQSITLGSQQYTQLSYQLKTLSIPNSQYSFSSRLQNDDTLKNFHEKINCPNFKNFTATQESKTTCTLTPDINEISSIADTTKPHFLEDFSTQISPDLLDRVNTSTLIYSDIDSTSNAHHQLHYGNCNSESYANFQKQKFFMLSNFCSEYDINREKLIHEKQNIINNNELSLKHNIKIPMATIKISIQKAIKILDEYCRNNSDDE